MELQLVSFEQAQKLEEIGIPQWNKEESDNSKMAYGCVGELWEIRYFDQNPQDYYSAPTLELAAKWLREEKFIYIFVNMSNPSMTKWSPNNIFTYDYSDGGTILIRNQGCYDSYELRFLLV